MRADALDGEARNVLPATACDAGAPVGLIQAAPNTLAATRSLAAVPA
jgi:hypothetical protein